MEWRQKKKLLFVGIPAGAVFVILAGILFFIGPLSLTSRPVPPQDLHILWVRPLEVREGIIDVAAFIENSNVSVGAQPLQYLIKVYDERGLVIALREGTTFIFPHERFVIFEPSIEIQKRKARSATIEFRVVSWQPMGAFLSPLNVVRTERFLDSNPGRLSIILSNPTSVEVTNQEVTVAISDIGGSIVGASRTFVPSIASGREYTVHFTWPGPIFNVNAVEVFIRPQSLNL